MTQAALALADHWDGGHMGAGWMWLWAPVSLVVFVAVVGVAVVVVAHAVRSEPAGVDEARRARSIVMERYARGEISATEYDELCTRLR